MIEHAESTLRRMETLSIPEPNTGCFLWLGCVKRHGYGVVGVKRSGRTGRSGWRSEAAHRVAWELANGPVPPGLFVLHTCDQPGCINPKHLYVGTQFDNMQDSVRRKRSISSKPMCKRGHQLSGPNLKTYMNYGLPTRHCRECVRINERARNARNKAVRVIAQSKRAV